MLPSPWTLLARASDVTLVRAPIPAPARYYRQHRAIVLRDDLSLAEQARFLWHEWVHYERDDGGCDLDWLLAKREQSVEREAARRAMPAHLLCALAECASGWDEFVDLTKLPESWVKYRVGIAHPSERSALATAMSREWWAA